MSLTFWAVTNTIKGITRILCRVHDEQLTKVPLEGPLILVGNHVNFLDAPIMFTHLLPRPVIAVAKAETWDMPFLGPLFELWGMIPIRRGAADTAAMRNVLGALEDGKIIAISPEGTRSGDGRLQEGQPGVIPLALRSGAPLLPVVYYGHEGFHQNWRRLRRTDFQIAIGEPFHLETHGEKVFKEVRQKIITEIMYQLAALMPPEYRGVYHDLDAATTHYLNFIP